MFIKITIPRKSVFNIFFKANKVNKFVYSTKKTYKLNNIFFDKIGPLGTIVNNDVGA